jgi:hypothetical protein
MKLSLADMSVGMMAASSVQTPSAAFPNQRQMVLTGSAANRRHTK